MNSAAELARLLHNLIRVGTIADVDHAAARVRFSDGNLQTAWLPWLERRAGTTRDWDPPTIGEQCMLFSPAGDPANGIVLTGLFSDANPAPSGSPDLNRRVYPDGATIEYDHAAHHLQATIPGSATLDATTDVTVTAGGKIAATAQAGIDASTPARATLNAAGGADITAPTTTINGNLQLNGAFTGAGGHSVTFNSPVAFKQATDFAAPMTHNGKTIDSTHRHTGVQSGGSSTGTVA